MNFPDFTVYIIHNLWRYYNTPPPISGGIHFNAIFDFRNVLWIRREPEFTFYKLASFISPQEGRVRVSRLSGSQARLYVERIMQAHTLFLSKPYI